MDVPSVTRPRGVAPMRIRSFSDLSNPALLQEFANRLTRDRTETAELIACMAEIDGRKLYLPAGYPSMFVWCVEKWHMSEDVAFKRIRAGRAARRFPVILEMIADGRLHLAAHRGTCSAAEDRAALCATLRAPNDDSSEHPRQAAPSPGPAGARDSVRRSRPGAGSRARRADSADRAPQVCRDLQAATEATATERESALHPRRREARGT